MHSKKYSVSMSAFERKCVDEYALQAEEQREAIKDVRMSRVYSVHRSSELDVRVWEISWPMGRNEALAQIEYEADQIEWFETRSSVSYSSKQNRLIESLCAIAHYQTFLDVEYSNDA